METIAQPKLEELPHVDWDPKQVKEASLAMDKFKHKKDGSISGGHQSIGDLLGNLKNDKSGLAA